MKTMKKFKKKIKGEFSFEYILVLAIMIVLILFLLPLIGGQIEEGSDSVYVILDVDTELTFPGGSVKPGEGVKPGSGSNPDGWENGKRPTPDSTPNIVEIIVTLPESKNQNQTHKVTLPGATEVLGIVSNTGGVVVDGFNSPIAKINVANGSVTRQDVIGGDYIPALNKEVTNQNGQNYKDAEGYKGTLTEYVESEYKIPGDKKEVKAQESQNYKDKDGFSGTLSKYHYSGKEYPEEVRNMTDTALDRYEYDKYRFNLISGEYTPPHSKKVTGSATDKYRYHNYRYNTISGEFIEGHKKTISVDKVGFSEYEVYKYIQTGGSYNSGGSTNVSDDRFAYYQDEYWESYQTGGSEVTASSKTVNDERYAYNQDEYWETYQTGGSTGSGHSKTVTDRVWNNYENALYKCHSSTTGGGTQSKWMTAQKYFKKRTVTYTMQRNDTWKKVITYPTDYGWPWASMAYNSGGWSGTLNKDKGSWWQPDNIGPPPASGSHIPGNTVLYKSTLYQNYAGYVYKKNPSTTTSYWKYVSSSSTPSQAPNTISYNKDGYTGTLHYGKKDCGTRLLSGGPTRKCSNGETESVRTYSCYYPYSGTVTKPGSDTRTYAWRFGWYDNGSNEAPGSIYYNASDFTGYIYPTSTYQKTWQTFNLPAATRAGQTQRRYKTEIWQRYSGTVRRPSTDSRTYGWKFDYTSNGSNQSPSTVWYSQNGYSGTLTKDSIYKKDYDNYGLPAATSYYRSVRRFRNHMYQKYSGLVTRPTSDTRTYDWVSDSKTGRIDYISTSDVVNYNSGGYTGVLNYQGARWELQRQYPYPSNPSVGQTHKRDFWHRIYVFQGPVKQPDTDTRKYAWEFERYRNGLGSAPNTFKYTDEEGYEGILNKINISLEEKVNEYPFPENPREGQTHDKYRDRYVQNYAGIATKDAEDTREYTWDPTRTTTENLNPPNILKYDKDGFKGNLTKDGAPYKVGTETIEWPVNPAHGAEVDRYKHIYEQKYSGEVIKPYQDLRVWKYQGTVTKPETIGYNYKYQGIVTKPAEDTREYGDMYQYTVKIRYRTN